MPTLQWKERVPATTPLPVIPTWPPSSPSHASFTVFADQTNTVCMESSQKPKDWGTGKATNSAGVEPQAAGEVAALKEQLLQAEAKIRAMKQCMLHSGLGCFDEFLVRRGGPVTNPSARKSLRAKAARDILTLSRLIQGPDMVRNIVDIVEASLKVCPLVGEALRAAGLIPKKMEKITDKRHACGYRWQEKKLVTKKNAFVWQALTATKNSAVTSMKSLMGKALIDTPNQLQGWAMRQPELPSIEFVLPGESAVWVEPKELLQKLLCHQPFVDSIEWGAPYDKQHQKLFIWKLVSCLFTCDLYRLTPLLNVRMLTTICSNNSRCA